MGSIPPWRVSKKNEVICSHINIHLENFLWCFEAVIFLKSSCQQLRRSFIVINWWANGRCQEPRCSRRLRCQTFSFDDALYSLDQSSLNMLLEGTDVHCKVCKLWNNAGIRSSPRESIKLRVSVMYRSICVSSVVSYGQEMLIFVRRLERRSSRD